MLLASTVAIAQAAGCAETDVTQDAPAPDFTLPNTGSLSATHSAYGLTNNNLQDCSDALSTCQIIYMGGILTEDKNLKITKGTDATEIVYTAKETAGDFSVDLQTECYNKVGDFKWTSMKYTVSYEKYVKTCTTKKVTNSGFTIKFPYASTNTNAKQDHFGLGHVENDCSYTSCRLVSGPFDSPWVYTNPSAVYDGATIELQFPAYEHEGRILNLRTKCTDELGNKATSDTYEVTYGIDPCFNDNLKGYSTWSASSLQKDLAWRASDTWKVIPGTYTNDMFQHNNQICPIDECVAMQGWTDKVEAVEASEGVEAVAEVPAKTCDVAAPANYQIQDTVNPAEPNAKYIKHALYRKPTNDAEDINICFKCTNTAGGTATQQFTVTSEAACIANAFTKTAKDKTVYAPGVSSSSTTPQFEKKHENFDMYEGDEGSVMTVPVFDNYLKAVAECSNTCTAVQKKEGSTNTYVPHMYTNVTLTNTDDIWRISYDTASELGFDNSFYVQCESSLGQTMTSDLIQVSVKPQSGSNAAVIIIIIIVLLVCCAVCCYYGHFVAGKPQTEEIETTAVDGNIDGKADMEAAGQVNAKAGVEVKGEFTQVPLDSARTDASGNTNAEKAN